MTGTLSVQELSLNHQGTIITVREIRMNTKI